jgi:hypothetical protein
MLWSKTIKFYNFHFFLMSSEDLFNKIEHIRHVIAVSLGLLLLFTTIVVFYTSSNHSLLVAAQQTNDKTYHSNATGATITFHGHSITSKTSNITGTNNPGITGFGPKNSIRNMTNPTFLMKNPLSNLSNPLANMTNPLSNMKSP